MPSYQILKSSTECPLVFLLVLTSDHISPATGKSPTVTISKAGAAFASPSGAVSEIANGWYKVAANATDTNTLGPLLLHATEASSDPSDTLYEVVAHDVQDAVHLGLSCLPNTAVTTNASLLTSGTGTDQITVSAGKMLLQATQSGVTIPTITTVTNQLTAAQIATGVWQDATSGDFTVSSSIGKSLYTTGATPGAAGGLFIAGTNAATTVTTSFTTTFTGNLTGSANSVASPVTISTSQVLSSARALDAIADTSLTLNDAFHCAIAALTGKESESGTSYVVKTPSTGTILRTFVLTLDGNGNPTARN